MHERKREGGGKRGEGRDGRGKIEERRREGGQGRERRVIQSVSERDGESLYCIHCSLANTIRHCLGYMTHQFT